MEQSDNETLFKIIKLNFNDKQRTPGIPLSTLIRNAFFNNNLYFAPSTLLQEGDIITVLKKHDNGKWFGQLGDRTGYFQFNYVQIIQQSENPD